MNNRITKEQAYKIANCTNNLLDYIDKYIKVYAELGYGHFQTEIPIQITKEIWDDLINRGFTVYAHKLYEYINDWSWIEKQNKPLIYSIYWL